MFEFTLFSFRCENYESQYEANYHSKNDQQSIKTQGFFKIRIFFFNLFNFVVTIYRSFHLLT
jgi:hypothetical protein